jgi:MFS transporter, DHA1 family, tetracycline resistance protein
MSIRNDSFVGQNRHRFALVLPVLFYEYLAISLAKSLIPRMIVHSFDKHSYLAVGLMETVKGILAFISCPLFGKLSDRIGRKYCLLVTVTGTTLPVCLLSVTSNMYFYAIAVALSGFFSATFPITFAYISDCVEKKDRAPAYGLALATFGLSFCIGPITGSYLALQYGPHAVFIAGVFLVVINILYIILYLPETAKSVSTDQKPLQKLRLAIEYLPYTWNFSETFRVFR